MALEVKEEDIVKFLKENTSETTNKASLVSDLDKLNMMLDKVNNLLSNPLVDRFLSSLFSKYQNNIPQQNTDKTILLIEQILNNLDDNMSVKDLKQQFQQNKEKIKQMVGNI